MSCTIHHIRYHCACGGKLSGAPSVIHGVSQHIAVYTDCIKHVVYHIKRMIPADHERGNHSIKSAVLLLALGKQLDGLSHLTCINKICCCNLRNSLCINIFVFYILSTHQGGKDCNFTACIISFHIRLRISFGIALFLCLLQHIIKICTFLLHFSQNVVSGSVQDTGDRIDFLCCQRIVQRTDDWNAASHTRLKQIITFIFMRDLDQFRSVRGYQFLVGGTDALAGKQRSLRKVISRLNTAHGFTDDLHLGVCQNLLYVMYYLICIRISRKISQIQNILNMNVLTGLFVNLCFILLDYLYDTASHRAISHYRYLNHFCSSPILWLIFLHF